MTSDPRLLSLGVLLQEQKDGLERAAVSIAWDFPRIKQRVEAIRFAMDAIIEELRQESDEESDPG